MNESIPARVSFRTDVSCTPHDQTFDATAGQSFGLQIFLIQSVIKHTSSHPLMLHIRLIPEKFVAEKLASN